MATYWIGTSGYSYKQWKGRFYPEALPDAEMLRYYATRFTGVEINYTFYRFASVRQLQSWAKEVPEHFTFTLKAPRRITHELRLRDAADLAVDFCENAARPEAQARRAAVPAAAVPQARHAAARGLPAPVAARIPRRLRVPQRDLVRRRGVRHPAPLRRRAVRGRERRAHGAARGHGRLRLLPPAPARLQRRRSGRAAPAASRPRRPAGRTSSSTSSTRPTRRARCSPPSCAHCSKASTRRSRHPCSGASARAHWRQVMRHIARRFALADGRAVSGVRRGAGRPAHRRRRSCWRTGRATT